MLSARDIEALIEEEDIESKIIELKSKVPSTSSEKKNLAKAVVAFANAEGGHIILGIKDEKPPNRPRPVYNICPPQKRDEILRTLRQIIHDRIQPSVFFRTRIDSVELTKYGVNVVVIEVEPLREGEELVYLKDENTFIPHRRAEKQCLPMRPEEIADFYKTYTYKKAEEEARCEAAKRERKVQEILEEILAALAFDQLRKGDLIPLAEIEDILTRSCGRMMAEAKEEEREEIFREVKQRLEATPLLRLWDKGVDFFNEAMRHYYTAKYLSTWDAEEIASLLKEPRWNKVWLHLFAILEERNKAEELLEGMLEEGQLTLALNCYFQRKDRVVGVINERLKDQLLRRARYNLKVNDEVQKLFIKLARWDPSSDVRQTTLRALSPDYLPCIPYSVVKVLLDALDDPVRNCQLTAISSLIEIAQRNCFPLESLSLVNRKIQERLEAIKDSLEEEEDLWPELVALLGYVGSSLETLKLLEEINGKVEFESQWEPLRELVQQALQSVKERIT